MIPNDKKLHVLVSLILVLALWQVIGWWSIPVAILVGVGKEMYDKKTTGFDKNDLIADGAGIFIGLCYELLIHFI